MNELHRLHSNAATAPKNERATKLVQLIEKSLGDPDGYKFAAKKSSLLQLAETLGVRCPPTTYISDENLETSLESISYPVLVKADGSWGGRFVRIVENAGHARNTICEFRLPGNWPTVLRQLLSKFIKPSIHSWKWRGVPTVGLQQFVSGSPANRAVLCWEGRVLAGVSLRVHKTVYTFGPASLVEIIDSPEMSEAADALVRRLKLSGMIGFDFVLDSASRAWLIEMNPRVTPACYLGNCGAADLSAALFSEIAGVPAPSKVAPLGRLIALFPQELQRSGNALFASTSNDDVPWEDPGLVLALLHSALRRGALKRLGMKRRNRQNSMV